MPTMENGVVVGSGHNRGVFPMNAESVNAGNHLSHTLLLLIFLFAPLCWSCAPRDDLRVGEVRFQWAREYEALDPCERLVIIDSIEKGFLPSFFFSSHPSRETVSPSFTHWFF